MIKELRNIKKADNGGFIINIPPTVAEYTPNQTPDTVESFSNAAAAAMFIAHIKEHFEIVE